MAGDVLVSHSGKQHAYKHALSLQRLERLSKFVTSAYFFPDGSPDRWLKKIPTIQKMLLKRYEPSLDMSRIKRSPWFEMPEIVLRKVLSNSRLASDAVCVRDDRFDRWVSKTQIKKAKVFWGFQGSCLYSLYAAKAQGMTAVAEFATAHVTAAIRILEEEKNKNPEWADSISNLYFPEWYLKRLKEEPFAADYCVAASGFTKKTLEDAGVASDKIRLLPLGVDLKRFTFKPRSVEGPFQALFVGGVGQRKGIKYLLDAYEKIKSPHTRLKVIGPLMGSGKAFKERSCLYEYLGVLPQEDIVRHMHDSHVLVLPSLFEGFGLVIPEAMASGMPVIASDHSAAPEIIREGVDGFVIRPDDVNRLAKKLQLLASDRGLCRSMGIIAAERARQFSWDEHTLRLSELLEKL